MRLRHIRGIDTLRAVGVIIVVIYHLFTEYLPGGFFGVDVFFVISGFLVASLFVRERRETDKIDIISFYVRRVQRLLPSAAFMVVVTLALSLLISPDLRVGMRSQTAAVFGWVTNYYEIMLGGSYEDQFIPRLFVHTWALAVEMQYYIIAGVVFFVVCTICVRIAKRVEYLNSLAIDGDRVMPPERRILFFVFVGLAAFSYARMQFGNIGLEDPSPVYYATLTRMYPLMIGSALGVAFGMKIPKTRLPVIVSLPGFILSILAILWMAREFTFSDPRTYSYGILAASLLAAIAISCLMSLQLKKFFGDVKPLAVIGKRSYSIYLFHWPLYHIFKEFGINGTGPFSENTPQPVYAGLSLAATAVLAELSYRVFEARRLSPAAKKEPEAEPLELSAAEKYAAVGRAAPALEQPVLEEKAEPVLQKKRSPLLGATIAIMCVCGLFSAYALINEPAKTAVEEGYLHQQVLMNINKMAQYNDYLAGLSMDPVAMHGGEDQLPPTPSELEEALDLENDWLQTQQNALNALKRDDPAGPVLPIFPPGGADVTLLGDSVPLGAADVIMQTLGSVVVDAEVSRTLNEGSKLISEYDARGELGEYIVLALFTNPLPNFIELAYNTLDAIPPGHRVIVVTPFGKAYMEPTADFIRTLPSKYDFVTVADWNTAIRDNRDLLAADGLHMKGSDSMQLYANLIAKAIEQASRKPASR